MPSAQQDMLTLEISSQLIEGNLQLIVFIQKIKLCLRITKQENNTWTNTSINFSLVQNLWITLLKVQRPLSNQNDNVLKYLPSPFPLDFLLTDPFYIDPYLIFPLHTDWSKCPESRLQTKREFDVEIVSLAWTLNKQALLYQEDWCAIGGSTGF